MIRDVVPLPAKPRAAHETSSSLQPAMSLTARAYNAESPTAQTDSVPPGSRKVSAARLTCIRLVGTMISGKLHAPLWSKDPKMLVARSHGRQGVSCEVTRQSRPECREMLHPIRAASGSPPMLHDKSCYGRLHREVTRPSRPERCEMIDPTRPAGGSPPSE